MKVFADFHHSGLFHSLKLLIEDRFGWELYRPCGMDWFYEEYWDLAKWYGNNIDTARQYLDIRGEYVPKDGTNPLNVNVEAKGIYFEVDEQAHEYKQKAITLSQFKNMEFDYIIASIPSHYTTYRKLLKFHPKAKLISHMGNMFGEVHMMIKEGVIKNLMASTIDFPANCNKVFYHQEFDLEVFKPAPVGNITKVTSFVNLLPKPELYNTLKGLLPDYEFRAYGQQCPDGISNKQKDIANLMQQSGWGYHVKPLCDGYGHIIHNWFAVGKPLICNAVEYENYMAGKLLKPDINCIAIEYKTPEQIADKIRSCSEPEVYDKMASQARKTFEEVVNFDNEEQALRDFFEKAIR